MTARSIATVATDKASRYLQQLCKHFAHKLPVEFDPQQGSIAFPIGTCRLAAEDAGLRLSCEASDAGQLAQLQDVIERHLVRFAFRENELAVIWQAA